MEILFDSVLSRLLATSLQTGVLAAVVWGLCRWLRRLPASTQCWLWWLVSLQALVGLLWAAPLELPLLPAPQAAAAMIAETALAPAPTATQVVATAADVTLAPVFSWSQPLMALWLAGVALMLLRTALAYRASRQLLRASVPCRDAQLSGALRMAAEAHGLRCAPQLRVSAQIDSPQLVGPWRPVLLLPERGLPAFDADDLDMALTHELVHLRRRDLWWGLLPTLAQQLFFFHPLVHLAAREYAVAREAACDAAVVAGNRHCRHDYGRLLVRIGVAPRPGAGLASASPSFLSLKRRLLMLQNTSSFPRVGAALVLAMVAVAGVMPMRLVAKPVPPAPPVPPTAAVPAPAAAPAPTLASPPTAPLAAASPMPAPAPAPEAATISHGRVTLHDDGGNRSRNAYVLVQGDHRIVDGSVADIREAGAAAAGNALWIRRDGRRYMVRDAATLQKFAALHEETMRLGAAQGRLGDRQGEIGRQLGEIGMRTAEAAQAQARAALAEASGARPSARDEADIARQASERAENAIREKGLHEQMQKLAQQQSRLAAQQAELSRQQSAASARAQREAEALIEQAINSGVAKPMDASVATQ